MLCPASVSHLAAPRSWLALSALLLSLVGANGCALEPDVGGLQQDRCGDHDRDPDNAVSFSVDIQPLLQRPGGGCVKCHTPGGSNPVGLNIGGLDLSDYQTLMAGGARSGSEIVVPGQPCESVLYLKLTSAPYGAQMPADGPPYWSTSELDLIHDWIAEGAEDN